jgi:hypothetical protein
MAAIASISRYSTNAEAGWGGLFTPPGYAQGDEGRLLGDGVARVAATWVGPSEYVATLLSGRNTSSQTKRMLITAGLLTAACVGFILGGSILEVGKILFPLAAATGLLAYAFFTRWLARQNNRSGVLRFAERIRRAIAYEGDLESRSR